MKEKRSQKKFKQKGKNEKKIEDKSKLKQNEINLKEGYSEICDSINNLNENKTKGNLNIIGKKNQSSIN